MIISISKNAAELGAAAARLAGEKLREAIARNGEARLVLSTGRSQFETLEALSKEDIDWPKTEIFHLDEYIGLPVTHKASFRKYLKERFVDLIECRKFHSVNTEGDIRTLIANLTAEIREKPVDVGLIGIGENGHIAFNDPPADFTTRESFIVVEKGKEIYKPDHLHNFSMYLLGKWYSLSAKSGTYHHDDPIGVLDVTILSRLILDPILGIKDLRTDKRLDFVGGIRGLGELQRRVDNGEMKVAFALFPVSMKQLITIADTGNIMPPKTTWFEPKLRSGLVVHLLE